MNASILEKVTSSWMGYGNSEVTKVVYQHIKRDYESEQIDKLAKFRGKK